jgi:uncharacterized protein
MPLAADQNPNRILGYACGEVRLAGRTVTASAIVTPAGVVDWAVSAGRALVPADLAPLLALGVDVVLLATGERQCFPAPAVFAAAASAGVGLEVMDTGAACRTYNVLVAEDRAVALALVQGAPP